jgi:hypothetical protein
VGVAPQIGDGLDFLMILHSVVEGRHNVVRAAGLFALGDAFFSFLGEPS